MADIDEAAFVPAGQIAPEDIDLSDETQDFRFLAALSTDGNKIPKRGEKDFEPHATALQSNTLAASRQAMHNALSIERTHHAKGYTLATYHPETNMAYTYNPKGVWIAKMGQVLPPGKDPLGDGEQRGHRVWLLPEEALYLLERGTIDIRWPMETDQPAGLPMSLQAAYSMFLGDEASHEGALTFEHYSVYTALRRGGYTVLRAPSWKFSTTPEKDCFPPRKSSGLGLLDMLSRLRLFSKTSSARNTLLDDGFFRSYSAIYDRLALISSHDPTASCEADDPLETLAPFRVAYHVYKPSNTTFKKSAPGPPDFRLAVINARTTSVPTLDELSRLMNSLPYQPPADSSHFYAKLKHGYKNVILAVVDQGVTSYLRFADAGFSQEKIHLRAAKGPAAKRGGRQGGRGK